MIFALLLAMQAPATGVSVSKAAAAEAALQTARYAWHRCVTLSAMDEVAGGYRAGFMSLAADNCMTEEAAVRDALGDTLGADGDLGYAEQQLDEWRGYEARWAQMIVDNGAALRKPKVFRLHR